jgi:hypothetical protein
MIFNNSDPSRRMMDVSVALVHVSRRAAARAALDSDQRPVNRFER